MTQEYRNIPGFKGIYIASINTGEIRSVDRYQEYVGGRGNVYHKRFLRGKVRKPQLLSADKKHYVVTLSLDGKTKTYGVQYLIAITFPEICGEWFKGCEVHHIDFDPSNNAPTNLMVVTKERHLEIHKDHEVNLIKFKKGNTPWNKRRIVVYTKDNNLVGYYDTSKEVADILGCSPGNVQQNCNGKIKSCKGFYCKWVS